MDFPPPELSMPPPNFQQPPFHQPNFQPRPFHPNFHHHKPYYKSYKHGMQVQDDFDGKRLRKSVMRKTVDYNASVIKALENRIWQRDHRDRRALQPENTYIPDLLPPSSYMDNPTNSITTRFVKTATNKMRCPVFTVAWTPEGRRLITGASSGEFTLWNGLTFNFETILQAHSTSVRSMVWSHNDNWMVTGDHNGFVKYWQSNMNNVKQFQAHKEPIRGISFCPTDTKFASCSDDGTVRIFDFLRCQEERVMRGHGADVKCVHWHPTKSLVVSGSKDNQQPIKLWDPKSGQSLSTLHAHKSTVMDLKWNDNGNWLITASRDHLLKLFDLRNLKEDMQTFRGHKKEASAVCWNPVHEGLFVSGGSDGQILFWNVGTDKEIGGIEAAHESIVWTLAWHPCGHILCSGSNDHTVKFWTRNRPGDQMRDKYNLNTLPASLAGLEDYEMDEHTVIPGMDIKYNDEEYNEEQIPDMLQPPHQEDIPANNGNAESGDIGIIPGLDLEAPAKKPFIKPIPKNFQEQWNVESKTDKPHTRSNEPFDILKQAQTVILSVIERMPGVLRVDESRPNKVIIFGKEVDVKPGTRLFKAIMDGNEALYNYLNSGDIAEMNESSSYDDNSNGNSNQDSATSFGNDRQDGDDFEPQAKRFRTEDFDNNYDNENSNSGGGIPSLLNINVPPPVNANFPDQTAQKSPTVWDNNSGFNNSNNGAFNSNANNQKPTQRTREGRRQGSRWSSRR